ncbi:MAG: hypothetical protein KGD65_14265 [Candidatus Lokiarchaeota archaeon]|nr:hypothetical protein [Candidatus Lokiarchaeota archaeon]
MKILVISDGKYGDRAIRVVSKKFPSAEFLIIKEENPTMFLDEVFLDKEVENAIEHADLLILYIRHPDVVFEICMRQKPTILPVHFGEGFFNQVKLSNPRVIQPETMCNAKPNTGIRELDKFFNKFGSPIYKIKIEYSDKQPIIKEVCLSRESPCGASNNTLEHIYCKPLIPDTLNNFALTVRQECREPMSIVFKREFSETAGATHLLRLLDAVEKEEPSLLLNDAGLRDYTYRIRKELQQGDV